MSVTRKVILADGTEYTGTVSVSDSNRNMWVEIEGMADNEEKTVALFLKFRDPKATRTIQYYRLGEVAGTYEGYVKMAGFYSDGIKPNGIRIHMEKE